ncbi:MAG: 3-hydroxyacyl-CoA dehydrogenase NAD-binding domain-containing protein [Planctomycetota bacterium]|nr:3-hydroxyacyl-CoA dehydrogenase NAD-binding domain-containing protein [Planctomycetota bacterium]
MLKTEHAIRPPAKPSERNPADEPIRQTFTDGLVVLEFDLPGEKINKLSTAVLERFENIIDELKSDSAVKGVVIISAKDDIFIAGADIDEIAAISTFTEGEAKAAEGQRIFRKLEQLNVPVLAAIRGACLGGGMELVLACDYRMVAEHPKTQLGLPEVNLGIFPGFGGTQRLPRVVGLSRGLEMILSGKAVDAEKALRIGLADWMVPSEKLFDSALETLRRIVDGETARPKRRRSLRDKLIESNPFGVAIACSMARKQVASKASRHYPAPLKAIDVIEETYALKPPGAGDAIEAREVGELLCSETSKNLIRVFRLSERGRKVRGLPGATAEFKHINRVSVLGAGTMGAGIAQITAYRDIPVRLRDVTEEAVARGMKAAGKLFSDAVKKRKMSARESIQKMSLISPSTELKGLKICDLVIEAVIEEIKIKKIVFEEIEQQVSSDAIIASNTSALSINKMAADLTHPERFIGMHFFNPPHRMPLVEIIPGEATSAETVATAVAFVKRLGKTPVVCADRPGFVVNRILLPYLNEAGLLLQEGATVREIDYVMTDFGMPMGPLELLDEVGIDVGYKAAAAMFKGLKKIHDPAAVFSEFMNAGRLGKKANLGFYTHDGKMREPDTEGIRELLQSVRESEGTQVRNDISAGEIQDRLLLSMVNEAAACLREKVVSDPDDLDLAMIFGTGFPPFRGGLLQFADSMSPSAIVDALETLQVKHGDRFAPDSHLISLAQSGKTFLG